MHVTAKVDYAIRTLVELASLESPPIKSDRLAEAQEIPTKYLENILVQLKTAGFVRAQRGNDGGYWLARPAESITLADVIRAVEGPLAAVRGERPEKVSYHGSAVPLRDVWVAVRASLRDVLETTTIADVAHGQLPAAVRTRTANPTAWESH